MASVSQEEPKGDGKKIKNKKGLGRAVLGCFLRNGQKGGPILSMVSQHVTRAAKGKFYFDKECTILLARKIEKSSSSSDALKNDVDLVAFTESSEHLVRPVYRKACGKKRTGKISLYKGSITELGRAQVFQCCGLKEKKQGRVLEMTSVPESLLGLIDTESNFIVDDINGEPFAVEGDSGRLVAREKDGGIELVGIITWGQYQCRDGDSTGESGCFSICLLLKYAIEYLENKYNYSLFLVGPVTERVADCHDDGGDDGNDDYEDDDGRCGGSTDGLDDDKCGDNSNDADDDDDIVVVDNDDGGGCGDAGEDENVNTIEPGQIVFFPI